MSPVSDTRKYTLQFSGTLEDDFLASFCPQGTTVQRQEELVTLKNLCTDQAGLIGILRRLHNLGCTLVQLEAAPLAAPAGKNTPSA